MPTAYSKVKRHGGERGPEVVRAIAKKSSNSAEGAAEIDPDKPLTDLQKAFVREWAKGESVTTACVKVGYSDHKFAYRLARMPNVLALKAKYEAAYEATAEMDRKQVMDGFKEAIDMARLMAEPANMIAGWREIGKMCGYYAPVETKLKIDITGNATMTKLTQMTDAELLELIEKGKNDRALTYDQPLLTDEDAETD